MVTYLKKKKKKFLHILQKMTKGNLKVTVGKIRIQMRYTLNFKKKISINLSLNLLVEAKKLTDEDLFGKSMYNFNYHKLKIFWHIRQEQNV